MKLLAILVVICVALIGASMLLNRNAHPEDYMKQPEDSISATGERVSANGGPAAGRPAQATLEPGRVATIVTNRGTFKVMLYEKDMPITCKNFVELAQNGFYKGLKFHRVEDWLIQGGDPKGDGSGGSSHKIKMETKTGLGFDKAYTIGMARLPHDRDSATSQFFVTKTESPQLTGDYAAFGRAFRGQYVVDKIKKGDVIKDITFSRPTGNDLAALLTVERPPKD
jgi:peptidyl-prolyl cis-trans isomerase B (cyclophilin B)